MNHHRDARLSMDLPKRGLYVGRQAQRIATPRLMTDHKDACASDTVFS